MHRIAMLRRSVPVLVVLAALAAPAGSPAAVTLGAPMNLPANTGTCQQFSLVTPVASCMFFGFPPAGQPASWTPQTPRGQWVVVRVRVVGGNPSGRMVATAFRALRSQAQNPGPAPAACCTINAQSQIFTPAPGQVTQIATRIPMVNTVELVDREPVEVVDYLGLKVLDAGAQVPMHQSGGTAGAIGSFYPQAVPQGQTIAMSGGYSGKVPIIQADYEPDADGDGFGDETQDSCATDPTIRSRPVARAAQCPVAAPPAAVAPAPVPSTPLSPPPPGVSVAALRDLGSTGSLRTATVPVVCPAGSPTTCAGSIAATTTKRFTTRSARASAKAKLTLKAKTYKVRPGRISRVSLRLPSAARKELRRRGKLTLDLTITQTAPTPGSTTRRVTLRRLSTSARASKSGRVTFRVATPAGLDAKKKATYELRRRSGKKSRVARRTLSTREGRVRTVRLTLNRSARRSLRRAGRLRLTLRATYVGDGGKRVRLSRTVTVRRR